MRLLLPALLAVPMLTAQAAPRHAAPAEPPAAEAPAPPGEVVVLAPRPRTAIDAAARHLVAQDLAESRRSGEQPLLLTGTAPLGAASDRQALFVQLQSARECGSAGCSTSVYLWQHNTYHLVLDGVGGRVTVSPRKTRGMADLVTDNTRYAWTGTEYKDTRPPPPAIDLRPRR